MATPNRPSLWREECVPRFMVESYPVGLTPDELTAASDRAARVAEEFQLTGPGGPNLQAQDTAIQAGSVPISTDTVTSSTSLTGLRQWQFGLSNSGTSQASGATIAVHTASTGPALNNAAQFGFSAELNAP